MRDDLTKLFLKKTINLYNRCIKTMSLITITMSHHTTNQLHIMWHKKMSGTQKDSNNDLITVVTSTCSVSEKQALWTHRVLYKCNHSAEAHSPERFSTNQRSLNEASAAHHRGETSNQPNNYLLKCINYFKSLIFNIWVYFWILNVHQKPTSVSPLFYKNRTIEACFHHKIKINK